ncbi:cytochrome ubiquinol oxidase subunit I [Kibdelosporangium philippinense]|uniref:Cytochrome ubiquinol oxidase subunit I n=1 Tax=Kibdelosporangium philippinense TaxID=211113 RepID=A0ABS8ZLT8_9PSEU|nr:cytochrome ubiquinol oxidase subunit I [Kibdelosporangium philippinense]MCE7008469.1 cytochrome ubiquinol oxidase subunit I [Kibdelosporangium philippinense]
MDLVPIARLQFATTTSLHFLFVLLTLGLAPLIALIQTRYTISRRPVHKRMTRFWGHLYVINYVLGIATGIVMEFQFGLNWTGLTAFAGDVFGAPLAIETLVAFFLESTFLGLWIFGWGKLNRWVHLALIWLVVLTAYLSAFWVMGANAFLQNPVGYRMDGDVLRLADFGAFLSNPSLWNALAHVLAAGLLAGGIFMAGVSAYHFIRRTSEVEFFRRSMRLGLGVAAVASSLTIGFGFQQFTVLDKVQPAKLGGPEKDAVVQAAGEAKFGPGTYLPPDVGPFLGNMIMIGFLLSTAAWVAWLLCFRNWIVKLRVPLYLLMALIPLPFVAAIFGWLFREMGRQPFLINGLLLTSDGVSSVSADSVLASYIAFTIVLVGLVITNWVLIARVAKRGPRLEMHVVKPEPIMATL